MKKKYLSKDLGELVRCPKTDLQESLIEIKEELKYLGQQEKTPEEKRLPLIRCCNCNHLTQELFCPILGSELSKDVVTQPWECESFKRKLGPVRVVDMSTAG